MSKISGVGDKFQEETRYHRERMPRHQLDWSKKPSPFKDHENPLSIIQLPDPKFNVVNIWETILKRRSRRNYNSKTLSTSKYFQIYYGQPKEQLRISEKLNYEPLHLRVGYIQ